MVGNPSVCIRKVLIGAALLASLAQFVSPPANAGDGRGGSDGGTNTNRDTKEPVEFQNVGKRVRIDPRTFEGLYGELLPKIRMIEAKVPGLGKELEAVLDQRSWFITDREFAPRNPNEEQPINQDSEHVFLTAQKIKEMSREQLKRAWMHEMVRRIIQDGHPETTPERSFSKPGCRSFPDFSNTSEQSLNQSECRFFKPLTQLEIDQLVEKLTVVLYQEYDMPARKLAKYLNDVLGQTLFKNRGFGNSRMGYLSRPEIDQRVNDFQLKEKYLKACKANNLDPSELGNPSAGQEYLLKPTSPIKNLDCLAKVGDVKARDAANTYVKECVKPKAQTKILGALNALRDGKIETDWHNTTEPFRTYSKGVAWDDGYDTYAHAPMNRYGSLGDLFGIGFFEIGISASISGKVAAGTTIEAQTFDDSQRIVGALQSCLFLSLSPDGVSAILNASSDPDRASIETNVVTSLDQALSALRSAGTRNPTSDPRETSNSLKLMSESPATWSPGEVQQVTNARSAL